MERSPRSTRGAWPVRIAAGHKIPITFLYVVEQGATEEIGRVPEIDGEVCEQLERYSELLGLSFADGQQSRHPR